MRSISISSKLSELCPQLRLGCIEATVKVGDSSAAFLAEMDSQIRQISASLSIELISKIPTISASRRAYKACGKDPARYRLSAEALLRRVVSGKGLYQINNVVDQLNLVSIATGFSIGGYDADQITGDVVFGIGRAGEPYCGIGRGELNIEFLPVFRDEKGAFGTPTSDSQRTEVTNHTNHFLMVIIDFEKNESLQHAMEMAERFLATYCVAVDIQSKIFQS
jgi:DNA/RNA-binding domain of Phe-tRNA-synthetase-like protein